MQLGMIGLGRMGANIVRRLMRDGHECVVYDVGPEAVAELEGEGAIGAASLDEFLAKLDRPRVAWVMIPAGITGRVIDDLAARMEPGDIIIDGGNSYYRDDVDRAKKLAEQGIEYGLMAAYAEGLNVLHRANVGKAETEVDAETAPLQDPEYYQYDLDVPEIAELWRRGSVVSSWLLDLTAAALAESPELEGFGGRVSDSGEGRWTVLAAIEEGVPVPVLSASLYERFTSRGEAMYADRLLSAMRKQFGGHAEKLAAASGS